MRSILAAVVLAGSITSILACSGPPKKTTTPGATEGSDSSSETCCCKSTPMASDDGQPKYEMGNRMECSSKQGECVPDVQCQQSPQPD